MATKYADLNSVEGLQFIPVNEFKIPMVKDWQHSTKKHDLSKCYGVGLVCGVPSGNLECIDIDCKYDLTGNLFDRYKRLIHEIDEGLLKKLVVQKTKNGGFHFIYRCAEIQGNEKLANRQTTEDERQETYEKSYKAEVNKGTEDKKAKLLAQKQKDNDKVRVLIETRGIGGQFVCFPTPGYEFIFGDFFSISEISIDERDILFSIARQFNQIIEEVTIPKKTFDKNNAEGLSTFQDYNNRGDVVALLQNHGWKVVGQKGNKTVFLRPGQTTSQSSGNFDHDKNWFSVFTTSSEFEPEKAYLPYAVFAVLECNKDYSLASKKLFELGYGERKVSKQDEKQSTRKIQSRINPEDNDYSFLATDKDYIPYLQQVIEGTLPLGLTTGSPELDNNFLFKEGNLVLINGVDNTGKTSVILWLELLAAMYHGWKGVLFVSENSIGSVMRKLIQFYWGKQLRGNFAMTEKEFFIAKEFIENYFFIIKAQEDLFNYKDIINMVKKARQKTPDLNYCMIDPYNSLKIDLSGFSKLSTHEYHYEALSEIKAYGQQTNFGWFVNLHAVTGAARAKDGDKKYPLAPRKEDTEGGQKFPNKADDFLTIHRLTQHPTDWNITEIHVRKIKDTETGGRPTSLDMPIRFEMYKGGTAFREKTEMGYGIDPIEQWHISKNNFVQGEIYKKTEQSSHLAWTPYKDDIGF